ncbi:MAG TPA: hypothetical protein VFE62_09390, partial [Gemmataceae bacterium]|nr:hypothetical protein [Gemmataceae bacterium]
QSPALLGDGGDFVVASVDPNAGPETSPNPIAREYPEALQRMWKERDNYYRTGPYRLAARRFQTRQAWLQFLARNDAAPVLSTNLKWTRPSSGKAIDRVKLLGAMNAAKEATAANVQATFEQEWKSLQQQLTDARPTDAERVKKRFVEQVRARTLEAELDTVVFAHAVNDPQLDPGTMRLYDQLLQPATLPRTAEALRLRQVADLAARTDAFAWPRDVVEALLRCTELGEKAQRQFPYLPGYVDLLDEPAQTRHDGEIRLLTRGYANPEDARKSLNQAAKQFAELIALNERWRACEQALDEALAELPWYAGALEALPELREPWRLAAEQATAVGNALEKKQDGGDWWFRIGRLRTQIEDASGAAANLKQQQESLHAPFAKDALVRLERQCRAADADAATLRQAEALLSVAAPVLQADPRVSLRKAANALSRRLNEDVLAKDRNDNEAHRITPLADGGIVKAAESAEWRARCQIALLDLAGVSTESIRAALERALATPTDASAWAAVGARCEQAWSKDAPARYEEEKSWRRRERLAWLMSPAEPTPADDAALSPAALQRQGDLERRTRWQADQHRYLARAFQTLNLDTPGIVAARDFYSHRADKDASAPAVRMQSIGSVAPLTEAAPQRRIELELTRGASGPLDLHLQLADKAWLEAAPDAATLPEGNAPQKIVINAKRLAKAERSGMPVPLGFLVEARCDGRTWHHVVATPIVPNTQLVQLLVSTDAEEPTSPVYDIRIRPGNVKQPHYFYVKNLTNRVQKVHVEIRAGATTLRNNQKPIVLEPDSQRKVTFDDANAVAGSIQGPLVVRVLDENRAKVLQERTLSIGILPPSEYVRVAQATYDPGANGSNKWAIQVQAARPVSGPAIAAQLVLPVQRIPGLLGVGGGTLHADVPAQAQGSRVLFAENLRLIGAVQEEGP